MSIPLTVTRDDVKQLSVYKQGLHQRPESNTQDDLTAIIQRIGLLQLDSISVVARSHYLVMLARAGLYNCDELDHLLTDGFLFESWAHAACQIPMAHYPYFHARIQEKQLKESKWHIDKLGDESEAIIGHVLETVRENGAMSSKDFKHDRKEAGGWWNWKPTKIALEYLFDRGELMVSYRQKFQRYYDLTERVLTDKNLTLDKTLDDYHNWAVEQGLRHVGIGTLNHIADYFRLHKKRTTDIIQGMVNNGEVTPIEVIDWQKPAYIHSDDLPVLEQIQAGDHAPQLTLFLSPFDNLFWNRDRDEMLWDFYYRIEVYTPKPKRVYGYYVLPILHKGELVGRIDPKIDRKKKHLIIHALHLEDKTHVTDDLTQGLITAIEEFMAFHACETFELTHCADQPLMRRLSKHFG
jgi:uncharacterized protein